MPLNKIVTVIKFVRGHNYQGHTESKTRSIAVQYCLVETTVMLSCCQIAQIDIVDSISLFRPITSLFLFKRIEITNMLSQEVGGSYDG